MFREAVRITRHCGYEYLWIDSLCIVQDSPSGWEVEASRMMSVYGNAICTIAFLFPPSGRWLRDRTSARGMAPCVLRAATTSMHGVYISPNQYLIYDRFDTQGHVTRAWQKQTSWSLFHRAWAMQEHLLSPRTLLYGNKSLMWECGSTICDELTGKIRQSFDDTRPYDYKDAWDNDGVSKWHLELPKSSMRRAMHSILDQWYALVQAYRTKALTYETDRIMAFTGITRAFQSRHGLTNIAGAWVECLQYSLVWWMEQDLEKDTTPPSSSTVVEMQQAPTWSWYSCRISSHRPLTFFNERHLDSMWIDKLLPLCKVRHYQWPDSPINFVPSTGFHKLANVSLTLEASVLPTALDNDMDPVYGHPLLGDQYHDLHGGIRYTYHPDTFGVQFEQPINVLLALVLEAPKPDHSRGVINHDCIGLALVRSSKRDTWQRIGLWRSCICLPASRVSIRSVYGQNYQPLRHDQQLKVFEDGIRLRRKPEEGGSVFESLPGVNVQVLTLV